MTPEDAYYERSREYQGTRMPFIAWYDRLIDNRDGHKLTDREKEAALRDLGIWDQYKDYDLADIELSAMPYDEYVLSAAVDHCADHLSLPDMTELNDLLEEFLNASLQVRKGREGG